MVTEGCCVSNVHASACGAASSTGINTAKKQRLLERELGAAGGNEFVVILWAWGLGSEKASGVAALFHQLLTMDAESLARVVPPYICCQLIHWFRDVRCSDECSAAFAILGRKNMLNPLQPAVSHRKKDDEEGSGT
jgi:hypothetical protein